jgi:hypothetical protein
MNRAACDPPALRPLEPDRRALVLALRFEGRRLEGARAEAIVRVFDARDEERWHYLTLPRITKDEARHSPAGFEWGYAGSGPAELARAMLMRAFPGDPPACGVRHPVVYQWFKGAVVQRLPRAGWTLEGAALLEWYDAVREA